MKGLVFMTRIYTKLWGNFTQNFENNLHKTMKAI